MNITKEWIEEIIEQYGDFHYISAEIIYDKIQEEFARLHENYHHDTINRPDIENFTEKE